MKGKENQINTILRENRAALLISSGFFFLWLILLAYKYFHFGYDDWDLAFGTAGMWQLLKGSQYIPLFDITFLGNHATFIAFLVLPLYRLFPHPLTLVFLKLLSITLGGWMIYVIAKGKLKNRSIALGLLLLFFLFPANVFPVLYEFHFESFAIFFLPLLFYFFEQEKKAGFIVTALLVTITKENLPLVIFALGIYGLWRKKNKLFWGALPAFWGILSFYILSAYVIPFFRGSNVHPFITRYSHFGVKSLEELMLLFINQPREIMAYLFSQSNVAFILKLFGPLIILSLLGADIIFLISPILLQHLLSNNTPEQSLYFHYPLTLTPFVFLASIIGCKRLKSIFPNTSRLVDVMAVFISACFLFSACYLPELIRYFKQLDTRLSEARWKMVRTIPNNSPVVATFRFLAPLSHRPQLYSFNKVYENEFQEMEEIVKSAFSTGKIFRLPENVTYALIDFTDLNLRHNLYKNKDKTVRRIQSFFYNHAWTVYQAAGEIVLFKKQEGGRVLVQASMSTDPKSRKNESLLCFNEDICLTSWESSAPTAGDVSAFTFKLQWLSLRSVQKVYVASFRVYKGGKLIRRERHWIGYGIYPTQDWQEGQLIDEFYNLFLPQRESGEYTTELTILEIKDPRPWLMNPPTKSSETVTKKTLLAQAVPDSARNALVNDGMLVVNELKSNCDPQLVITSVGTGLFLQ